MTLASVLIQVAQAYLWAGAAVAAAFLLWGVDRIDPSARRAYLFRLLALPGVVGLWPLVLWRWVRRPAPDGEGV
jgi:hypothetical protein